MVLGEKAVMISDEGKEVAPAPPSAIIGTIGQAHDQAVKNSSPSMTFDDEMKKENEKMRALIVDDQSFNRMVHRAIVNNLGFDAELAENGKIAVDLHRAGASFDLILMDRDMPVMNGAEATKELRAMGVETKIVGVTAHEEGAKLQEFVEAGLDECYAKPISAPQIAALVKLIKETKNNNKPAEK